MKEPVPPSNVIVTEVPMHFAASAQRSPAPVPVRGSEAKVQMSAAPKASAANATMAAKSFMTIDEKKKVYTQTG